MNLNVPGVLLVLGGLVLGFAAVSNKDPREIIRSIFTGQAATTPISSPVVNAAPVSPSTANPVWV